MTIAAGIWEQVRQRANFACEFCGTSETDSGGPLSFSHGTRARPSLLQSH